MPDARYRNCKVCQKSSAEVGELSWTRLCPDCGEERIRANNEQLCASRGPYYEHWRRRTLAAFGVGLLDAQGSTGHTPG